MTSPPANLVSTGGHHLADGFVGELATSLRTDTWVGCQRGARATPAAPQQRRGRLSLLLLFRVGLVRLVLGRLRLLIRRLNKSYLFLRTSPKLGRTPPSSRCPPISVTSTSWVRSPVELQSWSVFSKKPKTNVERSSPCHSANIPGASASLLNTLIVSSIVRI